MNMAYGWGMCSESYFKPLNNLFWGHLMNAIDFYVGDF